MTGRVEESGNSVQVPGDVAKERAEIDGRRADFMAGAMAHGAGPDWAWAHAQERYPYPKVTRPRVESGGTMASTTGSRVASSSGVT